MESTYYLYRATKDPFYLHLGEEILHDLEGLKVPCGFAGLSNIDTRDKDDRMESFMLSETLKYLYLLFDDTNILNTIHGNWVFTTEGHPLFIKHELTTYKTSSNDSMTCQNYLTNDFHSNITSRPDFYHIQSLVYANTTHATPPHPAPHPQATSSVVPIAQDFEVFFGLADSVVNATSNIVIKGKDLIIYSLQGYIFQTPR